MSHWFRITIAALVWLALAPATGFAQSTIVGVARDSSGGVLPGVTVEAASDALIEGMRTAITDDQGLYRLVDLRPGSYTVTFTLPGFNSFKREGLQLAAEFTATINAELRLGALEETITVTGAAPVVDVTTAARSQVLDRDNPTDGQPIEVFARSLAAQARPTRNLDTFDSQRKRHYQALLTNLTWRIPGGGQLFGGFTMERERQRACTAPDDPNYLATGSTTNYATEGLCDDFLIDIPWKNQFKLSGTRQVGFGFELSMAFQSNQSPTSSRVMNVTRGVTRYPAGCPAPCPAGQIIMPTGTFGQGSLIVYLEAERATFVERINQLDFKLARRFQVGRVTLLPVVEVFNLNNSDAIISYVTTNALSASYLAPNSIMQGRMLGVGLTARW